jgi:hypothetical protein
MFFETLSDINLSLSLYEQSSSNFPVLQIAVGLRKFTSAWKISREKC